MTSLRPSFGEREAFRSALAQAYAEGRVDDAEFEARSSAVESAVSVDGLRRAVADLPQPSLVFPSIATGDDVRRLRRRSAPSASVSRRVALGLGAAALGFVVAGGAGRLIAEAGALIPDPVPDVAGAVDPDTDYLRNAAAIDAALDHLVDLGYDRFVSVDFYDNHLSVAAQSITDARGIDGLSVFSLDDIDTRPSGQFEEGRATFSRSDVKSGIIVEMARVAPEMTGGTGPGHAGVSLGADGLTAAVYVDGNDYGVGGGRVEWTADGAEVIAISRNGD